MELLEDIQPEVVAAAITKRIIAAIIDSIVLVAYGYLIAIFVGATNSDSFGFHLEGWPAGLWFIGSYLLLVVPEGLTGKTAGKWFIQVKVVKQDLSPADFKAAAIRHLLDPIDSFFLIGIMVAAKDKHKQRIGDRAADTVVIDG